MEKYEDQNVNTINIPKQTQHEQPDDLTKGKITYKISIQNKDEAINQLAKEFNELVKEIIETNNKSFLEGNVNIVEYLINKHQLADGEEYKDYLNMTSICLKVRENFGMLNEIGLYLPNLIDLNLSGSSLTSVEEIGFSFVNLKVLNISNCNLSDISGIFCFKNLEKLNCSFNNISDLIELSMCQGLTWVDLSNNVIDEEDNLAFLGALPKLEYVNICNNPIGTKEEYISNLKKCLSHVNKVEYEKNEYLDNTKTTNNN